MCLLYTQFLKPLKILYSRICISNEVCALRDFLVQLLQLYCYLNYFCIMLRKFSGRISNLDLPASNLLLLMSRHLILISYILCF